MYEIIIKKNDTEVIKVEMENNFDYFNFMDRILKSYDHIKILSVKYKQYYILLIYIIYIGRNSSTLEEANGVEESYLVS